MGGTIWMFDFVFLVGRFGWGCMVVVAVGGDGLVDGLVGEKVSSFGVVVNYKVWVVCKGG